MAEDRAEGVLGKSGHSQSLHEGLRSKLRVPARNLPPTSSPQLQMLPRPLKTLKSPGVALRPPGPPAPPPWHTGGFAIGPSVPAPTPSLVDKQSSWVVRQAASPPVVSRGLCCTDHSRAWPSGRCRAVRCPADGPSCGLLSSGAVAINQQMAPKARVWWDVLQAGSVLPARPRSKPSGLKLAREMQQFLCLPVTC